MKIPEGYQQVMPYLIVKDAAGFMRFMQNVFGAKEKLKMMRDETHIMHAEIAIGDSTIMFSDATEDGKTQPSGMFIYIDSADEAYRKALAEGAISIMPPSDQDYGRTCGITDPFGNTWWPTTPKTM